MGCKASRRKKVPKYPQPPPPPPPPPGPISPSLYPRDPNSRYNPQDPYSRYNPQGPNSRFDSQSPNSRYPRRRLRKSRYDDYDSDSDDEFEYRKYGGCGLRGDPFISPIGMTPLASFPMIDSNAWNSFNNFGYGYGCNNFEFGSMGSSWSNPSDYSPVMPMGTFF